MNGRKEESGGRLPAVRADAQTHVQRNMPELRNAKLRVKNQSAERRR